MKKNGERRVKNMIDILFRADVQVTNLCNMIAKNINFGRGSGQTVISVERVCSYLSHLCLEVN